MTKRQVKSSVPKHLRDEWRTPPELFELLNREFDFYGDAAATSENNLCNRFLSPIMKDALSCDWVGQGGKQTWFLNPPFSQAAAFLAKANEEAKKGATVVCLVRGGAPETKWWKDAVLTGMYEYSPPSATLYRPRHEIRYLIPRVQYLLPEWEGEGGNTDFPSALIIMRPKSVYDKVRWWRWK